MIKLTNDIKIINTDKNILFIVEDNEVYAKSLKVFLKVHFPNIREIKIFSIGEMCLLELNRNPCIVIIDYFLDSKYKEADNGLEIIKRIKEVNPQTNIIVLSVQEKFNIAIEAINLYDCSYVQKNQKDAFSIVEQLIKVIFNRDNSQLLSN